MCWQIVNMVLGCSTGRLSILYFELDFTYVNVYMLVNGEYD
jgi:hypothetical protein